MEMIADFRRNPPCSPPTHHHEQHCDCSGVIQIPGPHSFSGPEVGQSHWVHGEKGPAEAVLPLPAEEVQPAIVAVDTVILQPSLNPSSAHQTVWLSSATKSDLRRLRRVVRTAERIIGTTLPTLQELYSSRVSKRAGKITLDHSHPAHSLFELLPSGQHYRALSTRTTRHRKIFFPQAIISWTLDIKRGTHNTIIHYLFITHSYFKFQICTNQTCTHIIIYIMYCVFCYFVHCIFVYICILLFYNQCPVLSLSFCCTVELLSL